MTLTEKILARGAGKSRVAAEANCNANTAHVTRGFVMPRFPAWDTLDLAKSYLEPIPTPAWPARLVSLLPASVIQMPASFWVPVSCW
jgi:hypothetical protein